MNMTNSRQRILAYLQKQHSGTASQIARALGVTPANIRHHLRQLLAEGQIQLLAENSHNRRGRPTKVYALAHHQLGDNLPAITLAALQLLEDAALTETALCQRLALSLLGDASPPPGLTPKLNSLVRWLNQRGYHARWEAHATGPRLIFSHCPYHPLPTRWPAICQVDAQLLNLYLGTPTRQVARLEANQRGLPQCVFVVQGNVV